VKIYNNYILSLSSVLLLTTVILTAVDGAPLKNFLPIFILEAIVVTELFVFLNTKARQQLTFVSSVLGGGFVVYIIFKIMTVIA